MIIIPVKFQYNSIVFRKNLSKFVSDSGCRKAKRVGAIKIKRNVKIQEKPFGTYSINIVVGLCFCEKLRHEQRASCSKTDRNAMHRHGIIISIKSRIIMSGYLKIFLVVFICTIIGGIVSWILGSFDLENNTLLMIIQSTITLLLIILWVLKSVRNKDKTSPKNQQHLKQNV